MRKKHFSTRKDTYCTVGSVRMFEFTMTEIFLKEQSYKLMGLCMKVHRELGPGFKEVVYKDALELELQANNIPYVREQPYVVNYIGFPLRKFNADFVVYGCILWK